MNTQERADRLYNLLPAVYRIRDAGTGWQLQALLRVIAEQVNAVEDDISQLYENWFIETCQDWVVPYIGDLVGYQQVHDAGEPGDDTTAESRTRNTILIPRRDVGNTIYYRRRRGTLAVLEQLTSGVAGWPYVHAVEFYKYLGVTQNTNFPRSERGRLIDLRDNQALFAMGSPLTREAHTVDVRRTVSLQGAGEQGRYNIPSVGLFIWRLQPYSVVMTRAGNVPESRHRYTFNVLGTDAQLYTHPTPRQDVNGSPLAVDELNFPNPIGLRAFEKRLHDYYGEDKSLAIWTLDLPHSENEDKDDDGRKGRDKHKRHDGDHDPHKHHGHQQHHAYFSVTVDDQKPAQTPETPPVPPAEPATKPVPQLVDSSRIIPADLSDWRYHPRDDKVAVDTRLGRIAFSRDSAPDRVYVAYYYAFSADIGGGMYHRPILQPQVAQVFQVSKDALALSATVEVMDIQQRPMFPTIKAALEGWQQWKKENTHQPSPAPIHGVIEITDNGRYRTPLEIELEAGEQLQIRAADGKRPVLYLVEEEVEEDDEDDDEEKHRKPTIKGEEDSRCRFTLDGLLITGSPLHFRGSIDTVAIRHCTFVLRPLSDDDYQPHNDEDDDDGDKHKRHNKHNNASIYFEQSGVRVNIEHSILGSMLIDQDDEALLSLTISDSILDASDKQGHAIYPPREYDIAYAVLSIARCTVIGTVSVHAIDTAENCIFLGAITVARRQRGCMRFCSVVPGSRTPRRYNCQPDLVEQAVDVSLKGHAQAERDVAKQLERDRVKPRFNSLSYGASAYCQLARTCAVEIRHGADDESEMGVFHDLFQPQREANLRSRLDDFTPAGMEAGIFYVN